MATSRGLYVPLKGLSSFDKLSYLEFQLFLVHLKHLPIWNYDLPARNQEFSVLNDSSKSL